jgi:hypothetical protein
MRGESVSEPRPDSQALCDATRFWWEHRHEPRQPYDPGTTVGYMPLAGRSDALQELAGRTGTVMQTLNLDQRLIQFGGEEDGTAITRIVATLEELWPL